MKLLIGADHRGTEALPELVERLKQMGHDVDASSATSNEPCDYPEPAWKVASGVANGDVDRGILLCGTGIGMCITANKVKGVRAALVHDELTAELSRSHNDANVLCLSADLLGHRLIDKIVDVWLGTEFQGGRHARRVRKIEAVEQGDDPRGIE